MATRVLASSLNLQPWPLRSDERLTLKRTVVIVRHGARLPAKHSPPGSLTWPDNEPFWKDFKGHLTPTGAEQLTALGASLRKRYAGALLPEDGASVDGSVVAVVTPQEQRTVQSAWAFMLGLVPGAPLFFGSWGDAAFLERARRQVGVPVFIEPKKDCQMFKQFKVPGSEWEAWFQMNRRRSAVYAQLMTDPALVDLLDKLHKMTGHKAIDPKLEMIKRLSGVKFLQSLVTINEAHGFPSMANAHGLELLAAERAMLFKIAWEEKRLWFIDGSKDALSSESYGRLGAGNIGRQIAELLQGDGDIAPRLTLMCGYDQTIFALATHLGFEIPACGFGACIFFEAHEVPGSGNTRVRMFVSGAPFHGTKAGESRVVPLGSASVLRWEELPLGDVSLEEFRKHCC